MFRLIEMVRGAILPYPFWVKQLGARGEFLVRRRFHRAGYHCVAKNWRHGRGEIDLIMANGRELVFIEVKTRTWDGQSPSRIIQPEQCRRLVALAQVFMKQWPDLVLPWRYLLVFVSVRGRKITYETTDLRF